MGMQLGGFNNGFNSNPFGNMGAFGTNGLNGMQMDPIMQAQMQMVMMAFMQQAMLQLFNMLFQGGFAGGNCCGGGMPGLNGGGQRRIGGGNNPNVGGNFPMMNGPSSGAGLRALDAARSQLGVREASGRNDGVPANRYSNGRREPWCANFVAWSFRQAGTPLPGNQRSLASVQYMEDQMKANGMFHRGTPQPGDIIFFANRGGSDRGGGRHVGIVERVENGRVHTIEGNSSNSVRRRSYALNNPRISGYGRVGGPASTNTTNAAAGTNNVTGAGAADPNAAARLNRVLGGRFAGQGAAFVAAAQRHGLDPNLLAAIAMHETGNGTSNAVRNYNNPGGLMNPKTNWSTLQRFGSLEQGIDRMASNLKRNYIDKGLTSIGAIGRKYAPVGAANDPTGLNRHWANGVQSFLNRIMG